MLESQYYNVKMTLILLVNDLVEEIDSIDDHYYI